MTTPNAHPMAAGHIPSYVTAADGSDFLFTFMAVFTIVLILLIGVAYFTLHALPEKMAHKSNHPQFQLVGILALLALFTHNNIFWVAAILMAGFQIPDLAAPLRSIADAVRGLGREPEPPAAQGGGDPDPQPEKPDAPVPVQGEPVAEGH
ncbi:MULTISPECIES: hypothetical protein [unclassified Leisingera]|uniref:hypothetical protein n=1 Tax=unclassified Leisingera TaxID=2614906 RepID=UPI0005613025|nr:MULTISPECIES: hypothetical protein [unclassified Leisingera]KIC22856.1 hypothetical protein RA23_17640 [Leisingera sp. ANG-S3]KIC52144.1 hypothetical protein RA22_17695 [Leisingera sp. ANG-S]KID07723.1 hypothetical protein GC1_17035 [Leisingera sp. ANG1]